MGRPNLGIKTPSKAQNAIKQSGPKQPPRRILKSQGEPSSSNPKEKKYYSGKKDYSALKSSPSFKEAQCALGPRPNTEERPARGLLATRGSISASPEASPPRPLAARRISA